MTQTQHPYHRNEVHFIGRLGRDPEMSFTNGGKAVTKFSMAVNQGKDKDPIWLNVTCWEEVAKQVNDDEKARKGTLISIDGRLTQRKYNDRIYTELTADEVEILDTSSKKKKGSKEQDEEEEDNGNPF